MKSYNIGESIVYIDEKYINSRKEFSEFSVNMILEFEKYYYKNIGSFDDLIEKVPYVANILIFSVVNFAVSRLVQNGIMNYSEEDIMAENYEALDFSEVIFDMLQPYFEVSLENYKKKYCNSLKKELRGQWSGGGFGYENALKGAVIADALNRGSGILYDIKNNFSDFLGDIKLERVKLNIYRNPETLIKIEHTLYHFCMRVHNIFCNICNSNNICFTINNSQAHEAKVIYANACKYLMDKPSEMIKQICNAINLYPLNFEFYFQIYKVLGAIPSLIALIHDVGYEQEFSERVMGEELLQIPTSIEEINNRILEIKKHENIKKANLCGFDYNKHIRKLEKRKEQLILEEKKAEEEEKRKINELFIIANKQIEERKYNLATKTIVKFCSKSTTYWKNEWIQFKYYLRQKKDNDEKGISYDKMDLRSVMQKAGDNNGELIELIEDEFRWLLNNCIEDDATILLDILMEEKNNNSQYLVWKYQILLLGKIKNHSNIDEVFSDYSKSYLIKAKKEQKGIDKESLFAYLEKIKELQIDYLNVKIRETNAKVENCKGVIRRKEEEKSNNSIGTILGAYGFMGVYLGGILLIGYVIARFVLEIIFGKTIAEIISNVAGIIGIIVIICILRELNIPNAYEISKEIRIYDEKIVDYEREKTQLEQEIDSWKQHFENEKKWIKQNFT